MHVALWKLSPCLKQIDRIYHTNSYAISSKFVTTSKVKFRVKKKSTFTPSSGRDKCLDLYIELVKDDLVANLRKSNKP